MFLNRIGNPHKNPLLERFYVVCKRAGITDAMPGGSVDLHALRHTFTTMSIENAGNVVAVSRIMSHSTTAMTTNIYLKLTDRAKRAAISALPFAKASAPAHVVSERESVKVG